MVAWSIALVNVAVFAYQFRLGESRAAVRFIYEYGLVPARFGVDFAGAIPTLVTHAFLHASIAHLLGNMIFLLVFGDNVEDRLGHWRFLLFYLGGAAVAATAQALLGGDPRTPLVGASGAISSCLGAYMRLFPRQHVQALIPVLVGPWLIVRLFSRQRPWFAPWLPAWAFLGYWALIQATEALGATVADAGGVAWWAHVGGFGYGVLLAKSVARSEPRANEPYFG
ncbi:MAG TPA: rhomboid family intramembrane serine protease [Trueperaceae bacterium]|nr:rhomboid family intramembrane serine protease [Trueperaceae bacterium]